ncbi:MAG: phosphoribosyltransferase family protein [Bacteroidales bacterium]|nr:phosphoribosyltransferase family protein [Bacteroidales bacterium]
MNKRFFKSIFQDISGVIFPEVCLACQSRLDKHESIICMACLSNLPQTYFHKQPDNPVAKIFWGRVPLVNAAAFLYFSKKGKVQQMLHHLKYKSNKDIGILLGKLYGFELLKEEAFNNIDFIVPVPLHPDKLKKRGYNQSEMIGLGLSQVMNIPMNTVFFERTIFTETQTKKTRYRRWENVNNIFTVKETLSFEGKHILLVDDVITTGATIEACAQELLKVRDIKISVVSIATAMSL